MCGSERLQGQRLSPSPPPSQRDTEPITKALVLLLGCSPELEDKTILWKIAHNLT